MSHVFADFLKLQNEGLGEADFSNSWPFDLLECHLCRVAGNTVRTHMVCEFR